MSSRRFAAYFFAIVAGSTFAFASTLRGQPPVSGGIPEADARQAALEREMREAGMNPTAADVGADALSPETARLFRQSWGRRHHVPVARIARMR